jgi:N-acetylneuraminic acid mutarotase
LLAISIVYILSPKNSLSADTIGEWSRLNPMFLEDGIASHYSFAFRNNLYILGGANSTVPPNGLFSTIFSDGLISSWKNITSPPNVFWQSGAIYNNYVYLLGGADSSIQNSNKVFLGTIEPDGNIIFWNITTPLPYPLALGNAVSLGNKIYFAGGTTNNMDAWFSRDEIYLTNINPVDGTLDQWITLTRKLPFDGARIEFGMVEINNYLYIIGGKNISNQILNTVQRAFIYDDGTLGNWENMPQLPKAVTRSGITKTNNLLVSVGGITTSGIIDEVYFANINPDGSISDWQTSSEKLPRINCCSPLVSWDDNLYLIGGHYETPYGYYSDVLASKIISDNINYISLNVPNLKQYEGGWENDIYGNTNKTIKNYGCALTSASMVLKFFGHNINPGELNIWLKEQKDGYIRNNLVNWLAISRYTKLHESISSPTLEYLRSAFEANKILNNLQNNLPTIVNVPGHFVVTKSQTETSFGINDPGYNDRDELLPEYPDNHIQSLNTYTQSHTDLSYMMFIADQDITFKLFDSSNNLINNIQTYIEEPINGLDGSGKSGEPLSILIFSKPPPGEYTLEITGPTGPYQLDSYLYDIDGNVTQNIFNGYIFDSEKDTYLIYFNRNKNVGISYSEIYKSLQMAFENRYIFNKGILTAIKAQIQASEKLISNNMIFPSKIIIQTLIKQIQNLTPKFIDPEFSLSLQSDLKSLIY